MWPRQSTWICGEKVGWNGIIIIWYDQILESVLEIGNNFYYNLLCHFSVWTDKGIQVKRPDLVIIDKREKSGNYRRLWVMSKGEWQG